MCSTSLAIFDRRNGSVVHSVPFPDAQNPDLIPPPETFIWHYVRYEYFKALLTNRSIWFTRLDKQTDKTDGNYSEANAHEMTPPVKNLMNLMGNVESVNWPSLKQTNQRLRQKTYVHCWSMRPHESPWMWNSFLEGETRSVAVRSSIGRLHDALSGQPVELKRIIYYPPGIPRPDYSFTAPFAAKDKMKHMEERELRIIMTTAIGVTEQAEHKLIPVDLKSLIGMVVVHPLSPPEFRDEFHAELTRNSVTVRVARSKLNPIDLQAVAKAMKSRQSGNS